MKKRLLAFIAVALSVLFVLPMVGPIVTFAAGAATTASAAQYVSEERNVALHKTVVVSDNKCLNNDQWKPSKLTDGSLDAGLHLATAEGNHNFDITEDAPVDVTVNLQGRYAISQVVLDIPNDYSWGSLPTAYTVQFSTNGDDWTDVYTVTNGQNTGHMVMAIPADKNVTSYIRLHITDDNGKIHNESLHNLTAIGELEAWGVGDSSWNQAPTYVDNNAAAVDTREGTLKYLTSEDGKTVTISYYNPALGETQTYTVPNTPSNLFGGFAGTDDLSRSLSEAGQNGISVVPTTQEKYIGLFYFLWHGLHDFGGNDVIGKAYNLQKLLEANGGYSYGTVGNCSDMHWFAEPLYGYYTGGDRYVMRKHAELLTNAGVDFLYFDITNNYSYTDRALVLMEILHEMNEQGYDAPQVVFYTNTDSLKRVNEIYDDIYGKNLYPDTWFCIDGKPVVVTHPTIASEKASAVDPDAPKVGEFFTMKSTQWPNNSLDDKLPGNMTSTNNSWPWMDFHWPQRVYTDANGENGAISVSAAQHSGTGKFSDSATKANRYQYNRGRSFISNGTKTDNVSYSRLDTAYNSQASARWTAWNNDNSLSNYGYNFQEQFDYALAQSNVKYILVTGWNEWVATNIYGAEGRDEDPALAPQNGTFVDAASVEFSRDLEMAKGYYFDNYYMQLVSNIQKAKGTAPYIIQDQRYPINVTGGFDQWNNIALTYTDPANDISVRDHKAYGETAWTTLTNLTGRNDIVASKVTSDTRNVYFYIETRDAITPYTSDAWMQVYVNVDRATTGWYGYDYIINYDAEGQFVTSVAKYTGSNNAYQFEVVDTVAYQVQNNQMMIEVPLSTLGITNHNAVNFEFKVVDGAADMTTMESFYTDGDAAPLGRLNYIYHGRTTDALDPASNDAAPDVIPEVVEKEYVKEEGFAKLWGSESTDRQSVTSSDATSIGMRLTVPANVTLTDFATQFTGAPTGTKITLRVYYWDADQKTSVGGVVLFEETKESRAGTGNTCTIAVNLPDADSSRAITDGDYFFVWTTTASGVKTQAAKLQAPASTVATNVATYANNSALPTTQSGWTDDTKKHMRASISYLTTTEDEVQAPDKSQYTQVSKDKAHIILLGGQSNGSGSTPYNDLALHDSANIAKYNAGFSNVQIYFHNDSTTKNNNSGGVFVPVTAAYEKNQGGNINAFGIEVGLAAYLSETYPGETFYIIKSGIGGSMLPANGADSSATYWLNNGTTEGAAWTTFKNAVNNATALLASQGLEPEIFGMIWMQGESDATNSTNAANYLSNMNKFMTQVESALPAQYVAPNGIAFLDIAIATNASWTYPTQVNSAKRQFAAANQNRYYLDMTHLDCFDSAHYTAVDMIRLGRSVGETVTTVLNRCNYVPKAPVIDTPVTTDRVNVALNKAAYGDINQFSTNPGWSYTSLTDGVYGFLVQDNITSSGPIFNQVGEGLRTSRDSGTIELDLMGVCTIDEIRLYAHSWGHWQATYEQGQAPSNSAFPTGFMLQVCDDTVAYDTWETVVTAENVSLTWDQQEGLCYPIEERNVTRIRFIITKSSTRSDFDAIGEMEVWGTDSDPDPEGMINVLQGAGVTVTPAAHSLDWPTTGKDHWNSWFLTDGGIQKGGQGLYLHDGTVGAAPTSPTEILIPLSETSEIYYFELYPFQYSPNVPQGYNLPSVYTIEYSRDGVNYDLAIEVNGPATGADPVTYECGMQKVYLPNAITARYIKITITGYATVHGTHTGIGELRGIGKIKRATVPAEASNVALGSGLTISPEGSTYNAQHDGWYDKAMVDGQVPSAGGLYFWGYDGTYFTSPHEQREITLDLGGKYEVYSYELHGFMHNANGDYGYPLEYAIYTSPDKGVTWELAYQYVYTGYIIWTPAHKATFEEAKIATHAKLVMTAWAPDDWGIPSGIGEFILNGISLEDDNIAKGKTATYTGGYPYGAASDGWGIQFVTDGLTPFNTNASSGMMYYAEGSTTAANGSTITIDLNGAHSIYNISLVTGYTYSQWLPSAFNIKVSTDGGVSYTTAQAVTGAATSSSRLSYKLAYTGVTHVQIEIVTSNQDVGNPGFTVIGEIEVNGFVEKVAGVTATPDVSTKLNAQVQVDNTNTDYPALNLIDADTATSAWRNQNRSTGINPTNILMTLAEVYEINSVLLYSASAGASTLPEDFYIEVSTNGYDWNRVYSYEGLFATAVQGQAFVASFAKTYAKYVRLCVVTDSAAGYSEIAELVVCGTAHSKHVYSEKVATADHLAVAATCNAIGSYYVSCVCGANGTKTFTAGGYAAHNYVNADGAEKLQDATCSYGAVYAKQCSACGKHGGGVFTVGATVDHSFTATEAHSNYVAAEKTCTEYATYYHTCATCNAIGTTTFAFVEGGMAPHDEDAGIYDKVNGERTYHCHECEQATRTVGVDFALDVTLGTGLDLNYYAHVDVEATNPVLNIEVPGKEALNVSIAGILVGTDEFGRNIYQFTYAEVGPQNVGTKVNLSLSCDENAVHQKAHAVEEYLEDLKTDADPKVVAAADALLVYAAAADRVANGNTSAEVNVDNYVNVETTDKAVTNNGSIATFKSATVWFDSLNRIRFTLNVAEGINAADLTFKVSVDGGAETEISADDIRIAGDKIYVYTEGVEAAHFDDVYTVTVYNGSEAGASASYSVNSYAHSLQNNTAAEKADQVLLAKALYLYGAAAKALAQ